MNKTLVMNALLARYFELARKEIIGATKHITAELDSLEAEIRRFQNEN